jgi:CubicO group peptidase (beta-lactamase class C family)
MMKRKQIAPQPAVAYLFLVRRKGTMLVRTISSTVSIARSRAMWFITRLTLPILLYAMVAPEGTLSGQVPPDPRSFADSWLKKTQERTHAPGLVLVLIRGNNVVSSTATGVANQETVQPMTPTTLCRIGSLTKSFTAAAVLTLAKEGRVELDKPIGHYLQSLSEPLKGLTLRQLLSHTAGFKESPPTGDLSLFEPHDDAAMHRMIAGWGSEMLFAPPGEIFSYSSSDYALLGDLISTVAAKPYPEAMKALVLRPLGMEHSTFRPTEAMTYPISQAHVPDKDGKMKIYRPYTDNSAFWASGFMFSNAEDLTRWAIWFLNSSTAKGSNVLPQDLPEQMIQIPATKYRIPESRYGFGLEFNKIGDVDVVGHVGNLPGFTAYLRMIPSAKAGVVALANVDQADLDEATNEALCYLLNKRVPRTLLNTTDNSPALENFVGQYENSSRISIVLRNGQLFWFADPQDKYASPAMHAGMPLRRIGSYRFARTYPGDVFFVFGSTGKALYVLLHDVAYKKIE